MLCNNNGGGGRCCPQIETTSRTSRTPIYIVAFVLLFSTTVLVLVSLSTNNWQITASKLRQTTYYTSGLWYKCKNVYIEWYNTRTDIFCSSIISISESWLIPCQVLYPIAAFIIVFAFLVSIIGFCMDISNYQAGIPSFIQWSLLASTVLQLITVSVYGAKGIADYTLQEPDYSLIIAAIATGLSAICTILFILETECSGTKRIQKDYTKQ